MTTSNKPGTAETAETVNKDAVTAPQDASAKGLAESTDVAHTEPTDYVNTEGGLAPGEYPAEGTFGYPTETDTGKRSTKKSS
jgi:hypothetical protein